MSFEALEVAWISCALLFAMPQAVMAILVACSPPDADRAITYYKWVKKPLDNMLIVSCMPLIFAIIVSWVYFSLQTEYIIGGYIVSAVITVLGFTIYMISYFLVRRTLLSRFVNETSNSSA